MANRPLPVTHHRTSWLWKLAFVFALVAGGIIALIARNLPDPAAAADIRKVIAAALVAIGVCAISATSHLWIKH